MASVYTNDLRLEEIGSGEQSGTWGDTTNTNLELIAEAFSFGTEAITTNADTHATTIADGATDAGRSMFLKYTGTLDSACTITIGPNTVSKLWFIENGTSGSQNIIIKQGSGATITIPAGQTKAIYSNGAGSGGAMVDAFATLNVVDLLVDDDLTVAGVLTTTAAAVFNGGFTSNADTNTFTSANASDPLVIIKNTANDASGARLSFQKDRGANAADGDDIGTITFIGDNNAQEQTNFGSIVVEVSESQDTDEAGKMSFFVAESNGSSSQLTAGLIIEGEHGTDGEVDVTIGAATTSLTTIAGDMTLKHDGAVLGFGHERAMLLGIRCADHDRLRGSQHYMHHARLRTSNSCCCALLCHTRNDQPRTPSLALRAPRCGWRCDCAIVPHRTCANAVSARWQLFELQPPYGQPSAEHRASRQRECAASRLASRGRPRHVLSSGESTERAERVRRVGAAPTRHEAR